ncbi:hypothetical protein [Chloroflexus sp.]|uniref:hypothetical protein n=1 Tax=Chloroflexus sp. TaxID=1904827 RepID=UPI002ADD6249|nr:hypothetical protein [Chloroflexus sp.]
MKALCDNIQQWLAQEWRALRAPILWIGIGVIIIVATISAQLPHQHVIDVGLEEGVGNADLPFLRDFNTPEESALGNFRWTGGNSKIFVPLPGNRPALIELRWLPLSESISAQAPTRIEVWSDQQLIAEVPVSAVGSRQWLYIPATGDDHLYLRLVSDVFQPVQDLRQLGLPLERIVIAVVPGGWVWPVLPPLLWWLGATMLGWLILHRTLSRWAGYGLAIGVSAVSLALILDPARWAFGAEATFIALTFAYPLTLAVQAGLRALAVDAAGSSLSAIVAIAFATRIVWTLLPSQHAWRYWFPYQSLS